MNSRLIFTFILAFFFSCIDVYSWTNYRFNFLSASIDYADPEYLQYHAFEIKKLNRTYSYLNVNFTILKPLDKVSAIVQISKYDRNNFKERFPKLTVDMCALLAPGGTSAGKGVSQAFFTKMKEPVLNMLLGEGQNFPKSCPVPIDNYYVKVHVNEDNFPGYIFSAGKWKVDLTLLHVKRSYQKTNMIFEITQYISETQRKRG